MLYEVFEREIEFLRIDGSLAVVMGKEKVVPAIGAPGAGETIHRRYTNIWRKEGNTWRLYIRHANIIATPQEKKDKASHYRADRFL